MENNGLACRRGELPFQEKDFQDGGMIFRSSPLAFMLMLLGLGLLFMLVFFLRILVGSLFS